MLPTPGTTPAGVARRFVLAWLELEVGRRPVRHLLSLVTDELERALTVQLGQLPLHRGPTARLVRLLVDHGADGCEAVASVDRDGQRAAIAVALARTDAGWRVSAIEVPPIPGANGRLGRMPLRLPPRW